MENRGRLASQIAAEEGCRLSTARRTVMVQNFAEAGSTLARTADSLGLTEKTIRKYADRFGISFGGGLAMTLRFFLMRTAA